MKEITLKKLVANYNSYKGETFIISDCPFYINSTDVYNYTMTIGNKGGCTLLLDNGSTVPISRGSVMGADLRKGIMQSPQNYYSRLILPITALVASRIQDTLSTSSKSLAEYKHLYENKKKAVEHIHKVLKDHPEYLI